ncbi:MAG: DUF3492 domain-containing protein [Acidimicrobiales bacterium]|nr:DUF3492 domain-containing protein [Acidimicrobiales bacterium]
MGRSPGQPGTGSPRVLLTTEGTYPFVVGGVSTWCAQLIEHLPDLGWNIFPIAPGTTMIRSVFDVPVRARLLPGVRVWNDLTPHRVDGWDLRRRPLEMLDLPADLAASLLGWDSDPDAAIEVLVAFRRRPESLAVFRDPGAWRRFRSRLVDLVTAQPGEPGETPMLDRWTTLDLYRTLGWVAACAAEPTPPVDVHLVTAAGWAAIPAVVDRALTGTPIVLAEHGVYVREAYLAACRSGARPGPRWVATRVARGLARIGYHAADVVAPVTSSHLPWEQGLGVPTQRIRPVPNGIGIADHEPAPPPRSGRVVTVGRIDPLKDIHTLIEVAAEVVRRVPEARFVHHGPVSPGSESYAASCYHAHARLGLGDRFRFLGPTRAPLTAVCDGDIVLSTSISEGLPISLLEAMSQARPVVATAVGGVADSMEGCGFITPPGDVDRLADGVTALIRDPGLADLLGLRGRRRVAERYSQATFIERYRTLLTEVASREAA